MHPGRLAAELARVARELGVVIFERSHVRLIDDDGDAVMVRTDYGYVRARHVALATNVFPSLLKRNRLMTVPVYDYVLMTEPLTHQQFAEIGWKNRQGIADMANQFHYYRLSADDRILFGGYDAIYHSGGKVRPAYEDRPETFRKLASHFFTTFPQLEGMRFSHRWAGAIDTSTRFCAFFGTARERPGRLRRRASPGSASPPPGSRPTSCSTSSWGLTTELTELRMVRERPLPFPPEPAASIGINLTRRALDRADHQEGKRNILLKTLDAVGMGFDS